MASRGKRIRLVLIVLAILLAAVLCLVLPARSQLRGQQGFVKAQVPTFFLHGWNGSYESEEHMTQAIRDAGRTKTVVRVDVDPAGQAKLLGKLPQGATNPLVEVSFLDKTNIDYQLNGQWLKQAILTVRAAYPFDKYNVVAHSMGNMVLLNYLRDTAGDTSLPKLSKQVDLAGNFNGILGRNDEPNRMTFDKTGLPSPQTPEFQALLPLRSTYPDHQVDVLNVFGDVDDGSHSDGNVSNESSRALSYLLGGRARSYREVTIHGGEGKHSNLHESRQVDQLLISFLW